MIAAPIRLSESPRALTMSFSRQTAQTQVCSLLAAVSLDGDLGSLGMTQAACGAGDGDGIVAGRRVGWRGVVYPAAEPSRCQQGNSGQNHQIRPEATADATGPGGGSKQP